MEFLLWDLSVQLDLYFNEVYSGKLYTYIRLERAYKEVIWVGV